MQTVGLSMQHNGVTVTTVDCSFCFFPLLSSFYFFFLISIMAKKAAPVKKVNQKQIKRAQEKDDLTTLESKACQPVIISWL